MPQVKNSEQKGEGYKSKFAVFNDLEGMSDEELKARKEAIDAVVAKDGDKKKNEYFEEYKELSADELEQKGQELSVFLKVRNPLKEAEKIMEVAKNSKRTKLEEIKRQESESQKAKEELKKIEEEEKELEEYFAARKREEEETGEIDVDVVEYEAKKERYEEILDKKAKTPDKISEIDAKIEEIKSDIKAKEDRDIRRARRATIFMITRTNWGIIEQMTGTQLMNNVKGIKEEKKKEPEAKKEEAKKEPKENKKQNMQNGNYGYASPNPIPEPKPEEELKPEEEEKEQPEEEKEPEKISLRERISRFFEARKRAKLEREEKFIEEFKEENGREPNRREKFFARHTTIGKIAGFFENLIPSKSKTEPEKTEQEIPSHRQMHEKFTAEMQGIGRSEEGNRNITVPVRDKENGFQTNAV